jgi:ribosomal protein L2
LTSTSKNGESAVVEAIEYDPNRSAHIALVKIDGGKLAYILAGSGMKVGDQLASGEEAAIRTGNRLAAQEHPGRHPDLQHRARARQGRSDRPFAPEPRLA